MTVSGLTTKEFNIMKILWDNEKPLSVSEISKLSGKKIKTINKVVGHLEKKNFIICKEIGLDIVCSVVIDAETFNKQMMDKILNDPVLRSFLTFIVKE